METKIPVGEVLFSLLRPRGLSSLPAHLASFTTPSFFQPLLTPSTFLHSHYYHPSSGQLPQPTSCLPPALPHFFLPSSNPQFMTSQSIFTLQMHGWLPILLSTESKFLILTYKVLHDLYLFPLSCPNILPRPLHSSLSDLLFGPLTDQPYSHFEAFALSLSGKVILHF